MKKKFKLLALLPAIFTMASCSASDLMFWKKSMKKETVNVVIISGQSNAAGCKNADFLQSTKPDKYPEYLAGYEDVKIAFSNWSVDYMSASRTKYFENGSPKGKFVKVQLGQGNNTSNFGPEVGIAEELHERWGNKLYLIKVPCGASNITDWSLPTDEMFVTLVNFVKNRMKDLEDEGYQPYLRAFCWMQGEGDSYDGYYQYYFDNLVSLKHNLDTELLKYTEDQAGLPFIDAGIGRGTHSDGTDEWKYYKEVNDAKKEFAALSDIHIYFDTIEAGLHSDREPNDDVHYDSESQIQLGHLFAQNFEKFLK